jgi:hypothetical protein
MAAQAGMATVSGAVDDGLSDVRRRAGWLVDMASLNGVSWVTVVTGDYILRRNVAGQGAYKVDSPIIFAGWYCNWRRPAITLQLSRRSSPACRPQVGAWRYQNVLQKQISPHID